MAVYVWTVYDHPSDEPEKFVARLHVTLDGAVYSTNIAFIADTLEDVRKALALNGIDTCLPRDERDDPVIVESWI